MDVKKIKCLLKPVELDALQFTGTEKNKSQFIEFLNEQKTTAFNYMPNCLNIMTLNGPISAMFTDYVIRDKAGVFTVLSETAFNNHFNIIADEN